jgi:ribonuclease Z
MSWLVQPRLVNGPFDDPGVYLDFRYGRRALLFDLGDVAALAPRELLRVSHAFVSHAHMDHFAGFDRLLRVCLHRTAPLNLVGPPGFIDRVEHKIRAFTWNLIGVESVDFRLQVSEFHDTRLARAAVFPARDVFRRADAPVPQLGEGRVLEEEAFRIEAVTLDHGIPSLAFALCEPVKVSVWRGALDELGLPVGPWLNEAKRLVRAGAPRETRIEVPGAGTVPLALLAERALRIGPGQKVAYVTDALGSTENVAKILRLAAAADQLFIEAVFLEENADLARATCHLTAAEAGRIARSAGVKAIAPFHHSGRYRDRPEALAREAFDWFRGSAGGDRRMEETGQGGSGIHLP